MKRIVHVAAGVTAMLFIFCFWTSTVISEVFLSHAAVVDVKSAILKAMWILVPAIASAGGSGFMLARTRKGALVDRKRKRMPFIAMNGLLILVPAAFYLHAKAVAGEFDAAFYGVQGLELLAGGVNLTLMGLNVRDGMRLAERRRRVRRGTTPLGHLHV